MEMKRFFENKLNEGIRNNNLWTDNSAIKTFSQKQKDTKSLNLNT